MSLFGWATERVVDVCRVRALEGVLEQDATFFDRPHTSNAKVIQRIQRDAQTAKAALDIHAYFVADNWSALAILGVLAAVICWPIALAGYGVCAVELLLLHFCGRKFQVGAEKEVSSKENSRQKCGCEYQR